MKVEELYSKYDDVLSGINVHPIQHFIFDLTDENSQKSLKSAFPGIETLLMPESGNYLIVTSVVESPDDLLLLFPEGSDGNLHLKVFDTKTGKNSPLTSDIPTGIDAGGSKLTIDNFKDFANMEDIANRFNQFVFCADGENSTNEVIKDIGSFDVSNDEPVEINNTTTDNNEETEMKFKPIQDESLDSELKDTKWVEIPNTAAHGVTVTEDDTNAGDDPFAGDADIDPNAPAPEEVPADAGTGDAGDATAAGTEEAPATTDTDAAAAPAEETAA